jgi:hypothetical protein
VEKYYFKYFDNLKHKILSALRRLSHESQKPCYYICIKVMKNSDVLDAHRKEGYTAKVEFKVNYTANH